jgi:hypothetical protein
MGVDATVQAPGGNVIVSARTQVRRARTNNVGVVFRTSSMANRNGLRVKLRRSSILETRMGFAKQIRGRVATDEAEHKAE